MTARVLKSEADSLGFDLAVAVEAHKKAVAKHAKTVGVPAPVAHPLVDAIVRFRGGLYEIEDDTPPPPPVYVPPPPTPAEQRAFAMHDLLVEEAARMDAILSPARRQLAVLQLADLHAQPSMSAADKRTADAIGTLFAEIQAVHRRRAELAVQLEELPDARLAAWSPAWEV